MPEKISNFLRDLKQVMQEFMYGSAASYIMTRHTLRQREELEHMFILMLMSDLLGTPLLPLPNALWLLPYVVPQITYWKYRLALMDEELEITDLKQMGH